MKKPNEEMITRWIDGELTSAEVSEIEKYLEENPEFMEESDSGLQLGQLLREEIPAEMEVPSAEFFNGRINHEIDRLMSGSQPDEIRAGAKGTARPWLMPLMAAAAALAIGFFGGFQFGADEASSGNRDVETVVSNDHTVLFSPDQQVSVQLLDNEEATVILLEGIDDLPESLELAGQSRDFFLASHQKGVSWE